MMLFAVGLARTARADDEIVLPPRETGVLFEWRDVDLGPTHADGLGFTARAVLGHCRFGLLAEVGAGGVLGPAHSMVGEYGVARIGSRILLARATADQSETDAVDLVLDVGVGGNLYRVGPVATQPEAFLGWATVLHGVHHTFELAIRVAIAPTVADSISTAICRGTCGPTTSSVTGTFSAMVGVASW